MEEGPASDDLPAHAWVIDPVFGRRVSAPDRLFPKVARKHTPVARLARRDLLLALAISARNRPDAKYPSRHVYYAAGVGPSRWLCMVVEYDQAHEGVMIAAFPCRRIQRSNPP